MKAPGRPSIDPGREIPALVMAKNENLTTVGDIVSKSGGDRDEIAEEREAERRDEEQREIVPPSLKPKPGEVEMESTGNAGADDTSAPVPVTPDGDEFGDEEEDF